MACQVLRDEGHNLSGTAVVTGGGYEGTPTQIDRRCPGDGDIEVYINQRDLTTGKPRWEAPSLCVPSGGSVTIKMRPTWTYDFRGVSVSGAATPRPVELHAPAEPDLVVRPLAWPPRATPGSMLTLPYEVLNQGTAEARAGYLNQLYVDGVRLLDGNGQTGSGPGLELTPGASDPREFSWRATCGTTNTSEAHAFKVWTDDANRVIELDEGNNFVEARIEVWCRRPVFEPLDSLIVRPNEYVEVRVVATDPDGDPLAVAMTDGPAGAWVDQVTAGVGASPPASLVFHWWPQAAGTTYTAPVTFTATDEGGLSTTLTLNILVLCDGTSVLDCPV
jgi:hypothetical protein